MTALGHFDADVVRAAQEEPTLRLGNLLYRGRLLSIEEWMVHAERLDALNQRVTAGKAVSPKEMAAVYRAYLRAVFPVRRWWWPFAQGRRYRWWAPDPVKRLMRQPWGVVMEATQRFFVLQARAMQPRPGLEQTNGPSSTLSPSSEASAPSPSPTPSP